MSERPNVLWIMADNMGSHWMGDEDFHHEVAVKVPIIIAAPRESGRRNKAFGKKPNMKQQPASPLTV